MSPILILILMAACVVSLFSLSGAAIWWVGRLPDAKAMRVDASGDAAQQG